MEPFRRRNATKTRPWPGPAEPLQGRRQVAPIFTLHRKSRGIRDGEQPALGSQADVVQRVNGQRMLSASTACDLFEKEGLRTRNQPPPSALNTRLEDIQTSDATFPVRAVFSTLQERARAGLQHPCSSADVSLQNHVTEKRKRADEGSEASKRQRCGFTGEAAAGKDRTHVPPQDVEGRLILPEKRHSRSSKLSRTRRLRQHSGGSAGPVSHSEVTTRTEPDRQSSGTTGSSFEDVLWTDKYSPQQSGDVIGNSVSVNTLHRWLKKWKLRADTEERKKVDGRKQEENSNDSWDCGDFQGETGADDVGEESLCNTMLITGPPGVGKTASVYACALELGFKVFEVNCSSQRSGRHVLSQLKEATQSHLVETSGNDPLKPAYFKTYATNSCSPKSETIPGNRAVYPKNVIRPTKKRAKLKSGRHRGKANPATVANYFKMKAKADRLCFGGLSSTKKPNANKLSNPSPDCDHAVPRSKKAATSLILFEEVDVIFEDDVGFLAAIKTFMATTKRPVILTTTDPLFRGRFSCSLDEIIFKTPSAASICSYLQLVALAENVQLQADDVRSLLILARGDVRRCLLQLQLWVRSGGQRVSLSGSLLKEPVCAQYAGQETGCTASLLGLEPVTQIQLLNYLKSQYWSQTDMNKLLALLAESWRQRLPLLYSNLELLLPIRAYGRVVSPELQTELAHSDANLHEQQLQGNVTLTETDSKHVRNISRLSRRKHNLCATTLDSGVKQRGGTLHSATSSDKTEHKAARVETNILVPLTDFFDLMSYLDAMLPAAAPLVSGSCRPEDFVWTGAEIKDGLLDERREEEGRSWSQENLLNIQAAVEGLGCHRCCWLMSEAWTEAQRHSQTMEDKLWEGPVGLPAASKTQSLNFSVQPLCPPSVSQRRCELSRAVFGSESFSLLGNRRAVSVDYMPILRSICRFQRAQQQNEKPIRYMNYMSGTCLGLSKSTMKLLAEDLS